MPDQISVGSSIGIGTERFFVLNKFEDRNVLRCIRGITGAAHTISSKVTLIADSFNIPVKTDYFDSKLDNIVYFAYDTIKIDKHQIKTNAKT